MRCTLFNKDKYLFEQRYVRIMSFLLCFSAIITLSPSTGMTVQYYVSPTGSDSNNGLSEKTALATFTRSYSFLEPGDILILLDGTYNQPLIPQVSGKENLPITFKAKNRGKAVIELTADGNAILVYSTRRSTRCHLIFDGLIARSHGEYVAIRIASADNVSEEQMTNNIIIRNTGAFGSAINNNKAVFNIGNNVRDCLVEDIWAYGFGRKALQAFGSLRITIRRAVIRYDYWDGKGYKPNDPRVDFSGYNTRDSIFENIIAIDSAPTPHDRKADRASFVASGNQTPALVSGSTRNRYLGMLALGGAGNGMEINGGTGAPNQELFFKDIIIWDKQRYGFNVQGNDKGSRIQFITTGNCTKSTGIRINPYPRLPITDEVITNCFSTGNGKGFYYKKGVKIFESNSATRNIRGKELEASWAPKLDYLVQPTMIPGHARGGTMVNRYVNGVLTRTPLWPWPNEELIQKQMCNSDDLELLGRVKRKGKGWEPAWCASGKTLTQYIWEYLGNPIPDHIYASPDQSATSISNQDG